MTEDLLETFAQGSEIKEIRMGLDKDTQDFKGFAHIELVSDGDLARALKKMERVIRTRNESCVRDGEKKSNGFFRKGRRGRRTDKEEKQEK